ncbi:MAG: arsenate reductase (azurin) large subunit [Candidatus Anammoxibacter sp.]
MKPVTDNSVSVDKKSPNPIYNPPDFEPSEKNKYRIYTTVCQYCIVGCGYKVHVWDEKEHSGPYPRDQKKALWVSPSMTGMIYNDGQLMRAAVVPDPHCELNHGNHSVRGGTMGLNLVSPGTKSTEDRLKKPQIRINGKLEDFSWGEVIQVIAELVKTSTGYNDEDRKFENPSGLGVKIHGYQFIENTFAATKLFFGKIGTPNLTHHDRPALGQSTSGLGDAGFGPHDFSYNDILNAENILLIGSNPYENASVFFMNYMAEKNIICVDPRRTITADYAVKTGGMHVQLKELGTDVVLLHSIARVILENGWEDHSFINKYVGSRDDIKKEGNSKERRKKNWRRCKFAKTYKQFKHYVLNTDEFKTENAAKITGVPSDQIERVAEIIAKPRPDSSRPRTSIIFEKGIIWGFNYENTSAVANLAVLIGSVGQSGRVTGRTGGHQKGWVEAASYPIENATDNYNDNGVKRKVRNNVDNQILNDIVKLYWVIGCNPAGQTNDAQNKWKYIKERINKTDSLRNGTRPENRDINHIIERFRNRINSGNNGLVLIHQDIYPNLTTMDADIVLPAAGWGEEDFTRWNGERRLRIYERFQDSPSKDCWPDWKIFREVATAINKDFEKDFGWQTSNQIFEEAANSKKGEKFKDVYEFARKKNQTGHDVLRDLGTNGIILPAKLNNENNLIGTPSLYPKEEFKTESGKLFFLKPGWDAISKRQEEMRPDKEKGEIWITNGRFNHLWNTMFTHSRNEYIEKRYPADMPGTILEINKITAEQRELNNGDVIDVICDKIPGSTSDKSGRFKGVVSIQDSLPDNMAFALFSYPHSTIADCGLQVAEKNKTKTQIQNPQSTIRNRFTGQAFSNNITSEYVDKINPIAAFKYGRGRIVKTGAKYEPSKGASKGPLFAPRNSAVSGINSTKRINEIDIKNIDQISFSKHILPLVAKFSFHHSALAAYKSLMDSYWIIPENGAASELVKRLKGEKGIERMPFGGPYFSDEHIQLIEKWIDQGAKNDKPKSDIQVVDLRSNEKEDEKKKKEKKSVLIIGGGVAGLTAGVELVEKGFDVTIITAGHRLGGKGSSWRDARVDPKATWHDSPKTEDRGPMNKDVNPQSKIRNPKSNYRGPAIINHGFHAVFGFYHNFIDLLKRVDAYKNLKPNDYSMIFMENGKLHPFKFAKLPFPFHAINGLRYKGLSLVEKIGFAIWGFNIFRQNPSNLEQYDYHTLASWSRGRGLNEKTLKKNIFRMLQEGDFNYPYGFSAFAALNGIIEMLKDYKSAQFYYFNGGITETLMDPIGEHFKEMGGKIIYWQKVNEIKHYENEITGVVASQPVCHHGQQWKNGDVNITDSNTKEYLADYYISTLPAENFQELNPGDRELWDQEYFRNMWSFDTVETFAYQIWLSKKITSSKIDKNVVVGLETPFSTVIDYKYIIKEYEDEKQLGSVIDMVGSQGFFHHSDTQTETQSVENGWTVEQIKELALNELVKYDDFKGCRDPKHPDKFDKSLILHEEFHENNARHNRFFLTLPKSYQYRPDTKSPYANLFLAGDWVKNKYMALMCMEAACISGKLAANEILKLDKEGEIEILTKKDGVLLNALRAFFGST